MRKGAPHLPPPPPPLVFLVIKKVDVILHTAKPSFLHKMATNRSVRASSNHDMMQVNQIVPGIGGATVVGAAAMIGSFSRLTPVAYAATGTLSAADLAQGYITNTGAGGSVTLTLPSAAAIFAAFNSLDHPLSIGDAFEVKFETLVNQTIVLTPSSTVTFANAAGTVTIAGRRMASVIIRCTSTTAFSMTYIVSTA